MRYSATSCKLCNIMRGCDIMRYYVISCESRICPPPCGLSRPDRKWGGTEMETAHGVGMSQIYFKKIHRENSKLRHDRKASDMPDFLDRCPLHGSFGHTGIHCETEQAAEVRLGGGGVHGADLVEALPIPHTCGLFNGSTSWVAADTVGCSSAIKALGIRGKLFKCRKQ